MTDVLPRLQPRRSRSQTEQSAVKRPTLVRNMLVGRASRALAGIAGFISPAKGLSPSTELSITTD
jgi:hypothetical protein